MLESSRVVLTLIRQLAVNLSRPLAPRRRLGGAVLGDGWMQVWGVLRGIQ